MCAVGISSVLLPVPSRQDEPPGRQARPPSPTTTGASLGRPKGVLDRTSSRSLRNYKAGATDTPSPRPSAMAVSEGDLSRRDCRRDEFEDDEDDEDEVGDQALLSPRQDDACRVPLLSLSPDLGRRALE